MKLIFLGIQGSGKSTQAKILSEKLNLPYIEMGQLLRERTSDEGEEEDKIREALLTGNLVPDQITISTLNKKVEDPQYTSGYILDGYPRNDAQLKALPGKFDKVFYISLPKEEAVKRLTLRARGDDTPEAIERRVQLFFEKTEPIIDFFRSQGILTEIDGRPSIEEVTTAISNQLEKNNETN